MNDDFFVLQIHYYLRGKNNHSMSALVHNECERCFVQGILALNKYVDGAFSVKIYAEEELGGIKNKYKVFLKKTGLCVGALASITQVLSYFGVYFINPKPNNSTEILTRIEVIEKIKLIMDSNEPLTEEEFDYIVNGDKDLRKLKSEYFKTAIKDDVIECIEINEITSDAEVPKPLGRIYYTDFQKCILTKEEDTSSDEIETIIYIVAPVLVQGRGNCWRGICEGYPIDFKISDKDFLNKVYNHVISFSNGTYIKCKMCITQKVNTQDNSVKLTRDVTEVYEVNDDENLTSYKIFHRTKNKIDAKQLSLFDDSEFN